VNQKCCSTDFNNGLIVGCVAAGIQTSTAVLILYGYEMRSLNVSNKIKLQIFKNRLLRKIFVHNKAGANE
jgi:hypothetical protein